MCMTSRERVDPSRVGERAEELDRQGWTCSEAVFLAISEALGMEAPVELLTGLGAGLGGRGHACGAVTGAIVALGLRFGRKEPDKEAKARAYRAAARMYDQFRRDFHSTECWEITDREPDPVRRKELCLPTVRRAAEIAATIINEMSEE